MTSLSRWARTRALAIPVLWVMGASHFPLPPNPFFSRTGRIEQILGSDDRIDEMVQRLSQMGATEKEKRRFVRFAEKVAQFDEENRLAPQILSHTSALNGKEIRGEIDPTGMKALDDILNNRDFGMDMLPTLELVGRSTSLPLNETLQGINMIIEYGRVDAHVAMITLADSYTEMRAFAQELGARADPLVCLNLRYALDVLGEEKTRELFEKGGIEYFARYSREVLLTIHTNFTSKGHDKPLLLAVFNKGDDNGAFYARGRKLDPLLSYYDLLVIEVKGQSEWYQKLRDVFSEHGRIEGSLLAGHGEPQGTRLGRGEYKGAWVDLSDEADWPALANFFVENPLLIFDSCDTGQDQDAIAGRLSLALSAHAFAPVGPNKDIRYILDTGSRIASVAYDVPANEFMAGALVLDRP